MSRVTLASGKFLCRGLLECQHGARGSVAYIPHIVNSGWVDCCGSNNEFGINFANRFPLCVVLRQRQVEVGYKSKRGRIRKSWLYVRYFCMLPSQEGCQWRSFGAFLPVFFSHSAGVGCRCRWCNRHGRGQDIRSTARHECLALIRTLS